MHVHLSSPDGEAKFWTEPILALASHTGLAMTLDWRAVLFVAVPAALMAHMGGLFALRHLSGFDPAELY